MELREAGEKIRDIKCLIIGDIMLDRYIYGSVSRISPEAPIPVVNVKRKDVDLGGAANVACNVRKLGAHAVISGVIGNDAAGNEVLDMLGREGIEFAGITDDGRPTTVKTRIVGKGQQVVRFDEEDTEWLDGVQEDRLKKAVRDSIANCSIVIVSDYRKGVCTNGIMDYVIGMAQKEGIPVIVDPKESDWTKYAGATFITPNFMEFCEALGHECENTEEEIAHYAGALFDRYTIKNLLVTRSEYGMTLLRRGSSKTYAAMARSVFDVSGAGDTVLAVLSTLLAVGMEPEKAVETANVAAGISVAHAGTYVVSFEEVQDFYDEMNDITDTKVMSENELGKKLVRWRRSGRRIVFTNGCFDILHAGHVSYLQQARKLGDILIIGLNSDQSVKRLKGKERPVNNETDRAMVLAALAAVDAVVIFDEDTPRDLIEYIQPDVLVKGGDYKIENIVGREFAGETKVIPLLAGHSTTNMIEKIREDNK